MAFRPTLKTSLNTSALWAETGRHSRRLEYGAGSFFQNNDSALPLVLNIHNLIVDDGARPAYLIDHLGIQEIAEITFRILCEVEY